MITKVIGVLIALLILIQFIPMGRDHQNPVKIAEPDWDKPETRELAQRACFDCHSNETEWPWYSNIAPASWLVSSDVQKAREVFNFSEWKSEQAGLAQLMKSVIETNKMPPFQYKILHPEAQLSSIEKQALMDGIINTLSK
jgi:mono/diheme cytochrome c family protein